MKTKSVYYLGSIVLLIQSLVLLSCDKKFDGEIVTDSVAKIPVTYEGSTTFGGIPYIAVPYNNGTSTIVIKIRIPGSSAVKIKEISKIALGTTSITLANLDGSAGIFNSVAIAVNGFSYTINTSITEFNSKVATASKIVSKATGAAFEERRFIFRLTMDDNSTITPTPLNIRITY